ncbi:hypothetical protein BDN71DRAFT_1431594 [Pleurotus eryngii]|uniref:Uncharacterized protein n=1 Tax=Pleurotus eryngii TaxID=5323 RepID=A0A9P5ZUD4_PLEER|nr:hypothetical protein BDN71DRAFT_1431594 [Pleurotus eryngii]
MSAIIAYDVSSQQAITATYTELQQQLLIQVAAGTGLTWFMENRKKMYMFAKRASNRKFKQEIEAKWLIMRTLSALKEKTDELVREFFDNLHMKMACTIAKAAQELRKRQQSEGGRAGQSGVDSSRKKGEQVAKAEEAMEVDGTGPLGMPKAQAPKEKVMKKEEFNTLIGLRIETLDEAMRRRMEKGKGKAMEEITVHKIVAPKKCATAKSKSMVGSETDEVGEARPPVAGPSKPSSDEGEEFPEPSDDDEESDSGKRQNPRRQAKPRKSSMALPKVEIVERNMHGTTRLPSLGPTNGDLGREVNRRLESNSNMLESMNRGLKLVLDMLGRNGLADMEGSVEQRSELAYQAGGSIYNRTLVGEWAQCHSNTPITPIVTEPAEPAPAAPSSLPPLLSDMPPPPPAVSPPHTPLPAPHHALSPSQGPTSPSTPPPCSPSLTHSPSLVHDLLTAPSPPGPSQPTPQGNTALANLSHALAQLQVPPPWMTRARLATPTETLRRSTHLASQTPTPDDSKALKRKAMGSGLTKTKRLKK